LFAKIIINGSEKDLQQYTQTIADYYKNPDTIKHKFAIGTLAYLIASENKHVSDLINLMLTPVSSENKISLYNELFNFNCDQSTHEKVQKYIEALPNVAKEPSALTY
jgi:hypothetical protein